jgi:hypothetical protein
MMNPQSRWQNAPIRPSAAGAIPTDRTSFSTATAVSMRLSARLASEAWWSPNARVQLQGTLPSDARDGGDTYLMRGAQPNDFSFGPVCCNA